MKEEDFVERIVELSRVVSILKTTSFSPGSHKSKLRTGGNEIQRTAPYIAGLDDAKNYSHRLSARLGKPIKKINRENKDKLFVCLVDMRQSLSFGRIRTKVDFALEIAGIICTTAIAAGDRVQLGFLGDINAQLSKVWRSKNILISNLYDAHRQARHASPTDLSMAESLENLTYMIQRNSNIFIISDFLLNPSPPVKSTLSKQVEYMNLRNSIELTSASGNNVGLIAISDICDKSLPEGSWKLKDLQNDSLTVINSGNHRNVLNQLLIERKAWFEQLSREIGIDYCELETTLGFEHLTELMSFFESRRY